MAVAWIVLFVAGLGVVFLYGWSIKGPHLQYVSVGLLGAGAAMAAGALLGFLFGIPKYVSSGLARIESEKKNRGSEGPSLMPSTNLAEISDWLTKLLLGVGLVQLTHLGGPAGSLVQNLADGLESPNATGRASDASMAAAGAILVLFSVLGFIMGYVLTTLWYGGALERIFAVESGHGPPAPVEPATAAEEPSPPAVPK